FLFPISPGRSQASRIPKQPGWEKNINFLAKYVIQHIFVFPKYFEMRYDLRKKLLYIAAVAVFLGSCSYDPASRRHIEVDLLNQEYEFQENTRMDTTPILSVAVSAIISPRETLNYYENLFNFISEKTGYQI